MEKMMRKGKAALLALKTLDLALCKFDALKPDDYYYNELRDSVIKRFEYSIDTFWKFLKGYLETKHGLTPPASPKGVFKACLDAQIISLEEERELRLLIENRNLTAHAYNNALAQEIGEIVPAHYKIMQHIIDRLQ